MRVKSIAAIVGAVVIVGTFLAGYWPQRRARVTAEEQVQALQEELGKAQTRIRVGELLGQVLTVKETAARRNYGQAGELSSTFFDSVRTEVMNVPDADLRDLLREVLARRDGVTASLAQSDPAVVEALHDVEVRLRRALQFVMPGGESAPTP
jgi:hypothetical protein